jgi:flagellin
VTDLGAATYNTAVTAVTAVSPSGYFYYQLGTSNDTENQVAVSFGDFSLGGAVVEVDTVTNELSTSDDALSLITDLDASIQNVNSQRSNMGSYVNRFQYTIDNLSSVSSNAAGSRSRVEDTDYSIATAELAKRQIIQQAATAMLAQANQQPQAVLSLLK